MSRFGRAAPPISPAACASYGRELARTRFVCVASDRPTRRKGMTTDARMIYVSSLRNTRALEQQGLQQMEIQVSRLERYPDYAALLQQHIATTRGQIARLDQALQALGESPSTLKETVTSVVGTVGATVHAMAQDETLKNLYAGYAFQYQQIAAYRSLIAIADEIGRASCRERV